MGEAWTLQLYSVRQAQRVLEEIECWESGGHQEMRDNLHCDTEKEQRIQTNIGRFSE